MTIDDINKIREIARTGSPGQICTYLLQACNEIERLLAETKAARKWLELHDTNVFAITQGPVYSAREAYRDIVQSTKSGPAEVKKNNGR